MSTISHKDRLISFLKRDKGGANFSNAQIKSFSEELRVLGIIDMSKTETQDWLMNNEVGQGVLVTLITYSSLGLLSKYVEIYTLCENK